MKTFADAVIANVNAIAQVHDDIGGGLAPQAVGEAVRTSLETLRTLAQGYR